MTPTQGLVYVVDDDASFRRSVARLLTAEGYEVATFASAAEFLAQHTSVSRGCVLADLHMPGCSGLELQVQLAASSNPLPLVFLSGNGTAPSTVKAMLQGAVDFLTKCAPDGDLLEAVGNASFPAEARAQRLQGQVRLLVAIYPDGRVQRIQILQSSGHAILDRAAEQSVRQAEPFARFPASQQGQIDVLQIIRTWRFAETLATGV